MTIKFNVPENLPKPWHWDSIDLTEQLHRELPSGHILEYKSLKSIARRQDNDDVLFELENAEYKYAVVHLTWAHNKLSDKNYPRTEFYIDWKDLFFNRILIDNQDAE